jgi:hypothetical protein
MPANVSELSRLYLALEKNDHEQQPVNKGPLFKGPPVLGPPVLPLSNGIAAGGYGTGSLVYFVANSDSQAAITGFFVLSKILRDTHQALLALEVRNSYGNVYSNSSKINATPGDDELRQMRAEKLKLFATREFVLLVPILGKDKTMQLVTGHQGLFSDRGGGRYLYLHERVTGATGTGRDGAITAGDIFAMVKNKDTRVQDCEVLNVFNHGNGLAIKLSDLSADSIDARTSRHHQL